ncbi:histone-binding protein N1/N2 isoform X2 [Esox lucius]|uniref:histone-binding protein N1/N2 isoform X2 n=1 Tax=Esox lucius TaxID=8010 RepID=UPI001476869E|nr:histone-binding protein N1/N2 isoform X2 [Esox lucius]
MVMEEASKLIGTGKRHLVMGDAVSAVNVLQEACGMLAKKYGDTADECGDAFFLCGKALLELARMENGVLGNALMGVPEEEEEVVEDEKKPKDSNIESTENVDEKTRDELRVQVYDAMAEEEKNGEKNGDLDTHKNSAEETGGEKEEQPDDDRADESEAAKDGEKVSKEEDNVEDEGTKGSLDNEEEDEDGDDEGEGTEEKEDIPEDSDDEEVGNLQLAWEMLEVAKVIYKRKESKEDQLQAAQAHLKLGEVAAEAGNYKQAVEDLQECLALQLKHLASDCRLLAETHYQLGLTLCSDCQYSQAIEHFSHSARVITSRLSKLQERLEKAEEHEATPEERKEMEELKALLPEILEKVEDANLGQKMAAVAAAGAVMQETVAGGSVFPAPSGSSQSGGTSASLIQVRSNKVNASSTSPASDISHLVRKKEETRGQPSKGDWL